LSPDFCGIWNASFDMQTIMNRLDKLGRKKENIMCHPDFPLKRCFYYEDRKVQKPADKGDYFESCSYTQYIDLMNLYASLRKASGERESYSLDAICNNELGFAKINYSEVANIKTLPYENYFLFLKYNINDVLLLKQLEEKNKDINMLYSLADETRTRMNKAMRKTISLRNLAHKFYFDQGYIMGNNHNNVYNKDNESNEKFAGALVGDPLLNTPTGIKLNGKRSKFVYESVIDFDLSALYPSIIRAFNIDTTTQYGRLIIDGMPPTKEYDAGGQFLEHLESQDWIEIGKKWFNLPSTEELINELKDRDT